MYNRAYGHHSISTVVANVVIDSSVGSVKHFMNHTPNLLLAPNFGGLVVVIFTAKVS
jgi:hypothetical protein